MSNQVRVQFPKLNKHVDVEEGIRLSDACAKAGYPLDLVCGGRGVCKKCGVDIEEDGEIKRVLSCQTPVYDGMKVMLKEEEQKVQILTSSILYKMDQNPSLKTMEYSYEDLKAKELGGNDWDHLKKLTGKELQYKELTMLQDLSYQYHEKQGLGLVMDNEEVLDVYEPGEEKTIYGIAFDLGTTSAVGYLYNMNTAEMVGVESVMNKQTEIGADVISRINYANLERNNLKRLQQLAVETFNTVIEDLCKEHQIKTDDIYMMSLCGNSTMQHLVLGLYPEYLGMKPFTSTIHKKVEIRPGDVGIQINKRGKIAILPLLGGFVGADTTAALLSLPQDGKIRLMLDLGTNGEIAVGKDTEYRVSSTACGPALEGAGLTSGMRGTTGAIERVAIEGDDIGYEVIGNVNPQGICGSGVIDVMAVMFRTGVIDETGAIQSPDQVENPKLAKRIAVVDGKKSFIIAFEEESSTGKPIVFSQNDVRQVQLAKAAIYTGCLLVIDDYGIKGEDLEEIGIAGAFGNYIDVENAQSIGMIPNFDGVDVISLGNAAGLGSQMFLISKDKQKTCEEIGENAIFVELANKPDFMETYTSNMHLENLLEQ